MAKLVISLVVLVLFSFGCNRSKTPTNSFVNSSTQPTNDDSQLDADEVREFSDSVVRAIIEDRQSELYRKMEKGFLDFTSESEMRLLLERIYSAYGKPLEVEFKVNAAGYKIYPSGDKKPMRKVWYAVRTTRNDLGTQFLFTEVVRNGDSFACAGFEIATFTHGIPPDLR